MIQPLKPVIDTLLGKNNLLVIVPCAHRENATEAASPLAVLGRRLAEHLHCYTVINAKYKQRIVDMADVRAIRQRKKVTDDFLMRIKQFQNEISENDLLPLVLIIQGAEDTSQSQTDILFGYGQGERGADDRPHRPTIAPSLLNKIRVAAEDQGFSTAIADTTSSFCGRESYSLNQLFRQKNYADGFYDPTVRSLLLTLSGGLLTSTQQAGQTAVKLAQVFSPFAESMPLVRRIAMNGIDTVSMQDLRYIFRLHGDDPSHDITREAYIDELSRSIKRNGLLHPLVLLQKTDGRYKILCGFRRYQAIRRLDRQWVEAKVFNEEDFTTEDFFNISLAENTKRRNLNPIEIGNFLESASKDMGLNNARLADRFGETLGIGKPGKKVSQSTIHKYRKLNQIRERGESPEMLSDVINETLAFSIAAEILAPLRDPSDRDGLYLEIIKPLSPTRPQLLQINKLLTAIHPHLKMAIGSTVVQSALEKSIDSKQKASTFIRLLQQYKGEQPQENTQAFNSQVEKLRNDIFGLNANKQDFNITQTGKKAKKAVTLQVRLKETDAEQTIAKLKSLLNDKHHLDELLKLLT